MASADPAQRLYLSFAGKRYPVAGVEESGQYGGKVTKIGESRPFEPGPWNGLDNSRDAGLRRGAAKYGINS